MYHGKEAVHNFVQNDIFVLQVIFAWPPASLLNNWLSLTCALILILVI